MNAKNVPLKLLGVFLVTVLCLWLILKVGIRLGIDLRGGHSLIYEIRTPQAERARLQDDKKRLEEELSRTIDPKVQQDLRERIDRVAANLQGLGDPGTQGRDLTDRMIAVLKKRIDPQGLRNIEWRPLGKNRIEIRMPAGREEARQAKNAYLEALEKLEESNLQRSEMRRVEMASPEQRKAEIANLAGPDEQLAKRLDELTRAYDELARARASKDKARTTRALVAYTDKRDELEKGNINSQRFQAILANYVSPSEMARQKGPELADRMKFYEKGMEDLRVRHPSRTAQIDEVDKRYRDWSHLRRGLDDPADLKRLVAKAGVLEFRIAPEPPAPGAEGRINEDQLQRYVKSLKDDGPEGLQRRNEPYLWFPVRGEKDSFNGLVVAQDASKQEYVLLSNQPGASMLHKIGPGAWILDKAYSTYDDRNRPAVGFEFDERGARQFATLTGTNQGRRMAILLDNEAYSAPVIKATISKRGIIEGRFTIEEVNDLVRTLEAGSLPARLNPEPVAESTFGPALGNVNLQLAVQTGYWGLVAVAVFMLAYYMLAGAIADVALILNVIFVLGAMVWPLSAVLTLPGIAGVILSIGMAVDANVLIYERLREEQAKGQSVRMALKNAYERAFSAIFDSNLTTLITCAILGWIGTEEVRGFAITLGLGVLFNLFTAVVVTRWIFQLLLDGRVLKKPVRMLQLIKVPRINWMSRRYVFYVISGTAMILGISALIRQGSGIWGVEFSAGTQAILQLRDDALLEGQLPDDGIVRRLFEEAGKGHERLISTARVETRIDPNHARNFLRDHDLNKDDKITLDEWRQEHLNEQFFKELDKAGTGELTRQVLEKALPPLMYQVSTSETDVQTIRDVAKKAFGDAQQRRVGHDFVLVKGRRVPEMGLDIDETGKAKIVPQESSPRRDLLEDFEGGGLFVVENVAPPMTETELKQRVREMRLQPDFAGQMNRTEVVGLKLAGEKGYSSFAVLVKPADPAAVEKPAAWDEFARNEQNLLTAALEREEAMVATNFDAAIAGEAAQKAIMAVVLSWLAMIIYLWVRFGSVQWGLGAVICLIHDVTIMVGLVAASIWLSTTFIGRLLGIDSFKIDLTIVTALLTIVGYSVNDTIVVFDRIRENRGKLLTVTPLLIDLSINQTLSRTLLTSGTVFIVVFLMYGWGGPGIHAFNYAMLAGVVVGTYSSIAIASPLLLGFKEAVLTRTPGAGVAKAAGS